DLWLWCPGGIRRTFDLRESGSLPGFGSSVTIVPACLAVSSSAHECYMSYLRAGLVGVGFLVAALRAHALGPGDVVILVNKNVPESQEVADHYCRRRGVPRENVIVLDLPAGEDISRREYNARMVVPLREALGARRGQVTVLLSVYGVPLRVGPQEPTAEERAELGRVQPELKSLRADKKQLDETISRLEVEVQKDPADDPAVRLQERRRERAALLARIDTLEARRRRLAHAESE